MINLDLKLAGFPKERAVRWRSAYGRLRWQVPSASVPVGEERMQDWQREELRGNEITKSQCMGCFFRRWLVLKGEGARSLYLYGQSLDIDCPQG